MENLKMFWNATYLALECISVLAKVITLNLLIG